MADLSNPMNTVNSAGPAAEPLVDPETLQLRRAVLTPEQGFSIYNRLRIDNQERNRKAAAIQRKANDEQPFNQSQINAAKQSWRRNASTGFLSGMVKRISPTYKQLVDTSRFLTHSHLKGDDEESNQKSETFQIAITKFLRKWDGWQAFWNNIVNEDVLFGYTAACWTDKIGWQPIFCRQDEALFPEACPMIASKVPLWAKIQNFLVHEMVAYLSDPEASAMAGWQLDHLVESINNAKPDNRRTGLSEDARKYQDIYRETSMGTSYTEGVKVVETAHLFVQESWGPVSHYIYDRRTNKLLFLQYDQFESMEECLRLMTVEQGNGKLHGSKGVGRILYNTAISVEQSRNRIVDALYLAALLLLEETEDAKPQQALTVIHPIAVIGKGYKASQQEFKVNWEAFDAIDQHMTNIAQQQVGAFLPGQNLSTNDQTQKTASEINYIASIEQVIREGALSYFWYQALTINSEIQRRIFTIPNLKKAWEYYMQAKQNPNIEVLRIEKHMVEFYREFSELLPTNGLLQVFDDNDPEDQCVQLIVGLFEKGLSPEEIYELANCPANQIIDDDAQMNAQALQLVVQRYTGNPSINQKELRKMDISKALGFAAYERLENAEEDNTLMQEAIRLQLMELQSMFQGDQIPVSPRDIDQVHMDTIMGKAANILSGQMPPTPDALKAAQNVATHYDTHLQQAIGKNKGKADTLQKYVQFGKMADAALKQFEAAVLGQPPMIPIPKLPHGVPVPPALPPPAPPVGGAPDLSLDPSHVLTAGAATSPPPVLPGVNTPNLPQTNGPGRPMAATPIAPDAKGNMPMPLMHGPVKLT